MSTFLMVTIRLILISVLLNTAYVKAEHQLSHLTKNHTLEQCDVCSHLLNIDDAVSSTPLATLKFKSEHQAIYTVFNTKQIQLNTLYARAPPAPRLTVGNKQQGQLRS